MAAVVEEKERGEGSGRAASGSSSSPRVQPIHDKEKYFQDLLGFREGEKMQIFPPLGQFV
jgi:hypothetical protein